MSDDYPVEKRYLEISYGEVAPGVLGQRIKEPEVCLAFDGDMGNCMLPKGHEGPHRYGVEIG